MSGGQIKNLAGKKTDRLLYDVFPRHIAEALRDGHNVVTLMLSCWSLLDIYTTGVCK